MISETHNAACDLESCINYGITVGVMTLDGQSPYIVCGGCGRNISSTCTPKE